MGVGELVFFIEEVLRGFVFCEVVEDIREVIYNRMRVFGERVRGKLVL